MPLFDQYRQFYKQVSDPDGCRRFLLQRIENRESVIYLALDNGVAAGFVQLYPSFSSASMRRLWILNDLFVATQYRRSGAGQELIEHSRQLAIHTGAKGLVLATAIENFTAQRLYEKLGFTRDHDFYHYVLST